MPAARVVEVLRYDEARALPLVDLSARFGGADTSLTWRTCVVVVSGQQEGAPAAIGLIADEATDCVTFDEDAVLPPPDLGPHLALRYLAALVKTEEAEPLTIVLDVDGMFSGGESA